MLPVISDTIMVSGKGKSLNYVSNNRTCNHSLANNAFQSQQNCHAAHQQNFTNDFAYSCICKFLVYIYKYVCVCIRKFEKH